MIHCCWAPPSILLLLCSLTTLFIHSLHRPSALLANLLLPTPHSSLPCLSAPQDDLLWCQLAEQKWGRHVRELAQVEPGGWAAWTKHRLSATSPRPLSPLDLVQVRPPLGGQAAV